MAPNTSKTFPQNIINFFFLQTTLAPTLTRQNSLQSPNTLFNNSPTLSRGDEHRARRKSCNLVLEKGSLTGESPLPRIHEQATCSIAPEEIVPEVPDTLLRRFLILIKPEGFLKERDEYSLYIFSPRNK